MTSTAGSGVRLQLTKHKSTTSTGSVVSKQFINEVEEKAKALKAQALQEAEEYITCDESGKYDGSNGLPAITFWQEKIQLEGGNKEVNNPRPVRVKFSVKRFKDIDVVTGTFDIMMNCVFTYPLAKGEYEKFRKWEQEQMRKEAQDVMFKREQYEPGWYPEPRAENMTDGEANDDNDKIDYRCLDPWGKKKKGQYIHPDIDQPWASEGADEDMSRQASAYQKTIRKLPDRLKAEHGKADKNNILGGIQWHEPQGCYPYVSFRKDWCGSFSEDMEVDNFPFDCQDMSCSFKDQKESTTCYYMPNNLGSFKHKWDAELLQYTFGKREPPPNFGKVQKNTSSIVGWRFHRGLVEFTHTNPADSTKLKKYPRMVMRFKFARMWVSPFVGLFLPLCVCWILTCFTWMMDPLTYDREGGGETWGGSSVDDWGANAVQGGAAGDRLGYLSGLLLTVVAFIPAIQEQLPSVPYATWIDEYLRSLLGFIIVCVVVQAPFAPGFPIFMHKGRWVHVGSSGITENGPVLDMGGHYRDYKFYPINEDCCLQIPSFLDSLGEDVRKAQSWDVIKHDTEQIANFPLSPYCRDFFLAGDNGERWDNNQDPINDKPKDGIIDVVEALKMNDIEARMHRPACMGHTGFLLWYDHLVLQFYVWASVLVHVWFFGSAWWYRRKERKKLTADTVMLKEIFHEKEESIMLYGHMGPEAQRWYPPGVKTINHGEELEVYLITGAYTNDIPSDDLQTIKHHRGDIVLDSTTGHFNMLSAETIRKIRDHGDPSYMKIENGVIQHEGESDMGARGQSFEVMEMDEKEELDGLDYDGDGMVGDGIPGADVDEPHPNGTPGGDGRPLDFSQTVDIEGEPETGNEGDIQLH